MISIESGFIVIITRSHGDHFGGDVVCVVTQEDWGYHQQHAFSFPFGSRIGSCHHHHHCARVDGVELDLCFKFIYQTLNFGYRLAVDCIDAYRTRMLITLNRQWHALTLSRLEQGYEGRGKKQV